MLNDDLRTKRTIEKRYLIKCLPCCPIKSCLLLDVFCCCLLRLLLLLWSRFEFRFCAEVAWTAMFKRTPQRRRNIHSRLGFMITTAFFAWIQIYKVYVRSLSTTMCYLIVRHNFLFSEIFTHIFFFQRTTSTFKS